MNNFFWRILGYNIYKFQNHLDGLKKLSKVEFWNRQEEDRDSIVKHHLDNTPWYKTLSSESKSGWDSVPILSKSDLQEFSIKNYPSKQLFLNKYYYANTSGSSGHPMSFWKNKECHSLAWAKIYNSYKSLGICMDDKEARFFGYVKNSKSIYFIEYLKKLFFNRIQFDVFEMSNSKFKIFIEIFKKNKIQYIYGYTNIILEFSKFIIDNKLAPLVSISNHIKLCIVTAEMCCEQDRLIIQEALGVPVFNEYGTSETSIIAIQNNQFNWEVSTDRLWLEVLDENNKPVKDGCEGRIIITDLYNRAFPFIRYEIGDIGSIEEVEKFPFLYLKSLSGRKSDTIYLPSGKKSPGLTFYYISRSIFFNNNNVKEFRIIQKKLHKFKFLIVAEKKLNKHDQSKIIDAANKYLEPGLLFEFEIVKEIEDSYKGKIQHFFSELELG